MKARIPAVDPMKPSTYSNLNFFCHSFTPVSPPGRQKVVRATLHTSTETTAVEKDAVSSTDRRPGCKQSQLALHGLRSCMYLEAGDLVDLLTAPISHMTARVSSIIDRLTAFTP